MANRFTRKKERFTFIKKWGLSLAFFCVILVLCYQGLQNVDQNTEKEKIEAAQKAVAQATVNCYALEGVYPPDLQYLTDHYGLLLDRNKYIYHYEVFASNVMPDITVLPKYFGEKGEKT